MEGLVGQLALEPHVDRHSQELKKVVDGGVAKKRPGRRYPDPPRPAGSTVPTKAEGAGVRPADAGGGADSHKIHGDALSCFCQQSSPEF